MNILEALENLSATLRELRAFGANDTEPKFAVEDALRAKKHARLNGENRWELYSTMKGVGEANKKIARAVNIVIEAAGKLSGSTIVKMWLDVHGY